jgi:hypothetical protein
MFEMKKLFVFNKKKVLEELRYWTWYTYANFVNHVVRECVLKITSNFGIVYDASIIWSK